CSRQRDYHWYFDVW
nr:immunoglobulin heavy chain junction region [Mus musculus]MBK4197291.1 immunoglobulin heavy chain junction region [Mus musculus]MBK4197292.1 immunoglobulin heavy chain junction region [Mus musculus]MBK4197293.1 immunoglobulin heavy chain junction region [Mus musculus]MBK4197294.1 immunoglobulin heavy chain junction region [Mus musculus]